MNDNAKRISDHEMRVEMPGDRRRMEDLRHEYTASASQLSFDAWVDGQGFRSRVNKQLPKGPENK